MSMSSFSAMEVEPPVRKEQHGSETGQGSPRNIGDRLHSGSVSALMLNQPPPLQEHKSALSHIRDFFSVAMIVVMLFSLVATVLVAIYVQPSFRYTSPNLVLKPPSDNSTSYVMVPVVLKVPAWQAYMVGNVVVWGIVLMVQGYRSDFVLAAMLCAFGLAGIVDAKNGLEGFMNQGNLTQCLLFIIAYAIEQAGILEQFALVVLGQPRTMAGALLRVIPPSALGSGILNSPAVATVMTPVVIGWAARLQLDDRALLLPMAIACSFGGSLTLVGCGPALVAQEIFKSTLKVEIGMFTTTGVAAILLVFYMVWAITIGQRLAPRTSMDASSHGDTDTVEDPDPSDAYNVAFTVDADCLLSGYQVGAVGLDRLPGVKILRVKGWRDQKMEVVSGPAVTSWTLVVSDLIEAQVTARGMALFRQQRGIRHAATSGQVQQLLGERHRRQLIEGVLNPGSLHIGSTLSDIWQDSEFVKDTKAVFFAARRARKIVGEDEPLCSNDVVLFEARSDILTSKDFIVHALVPNSRPPRDRPLDRNRGYAVMMMLLLMVSLSAFSKECKMIPGLIYMTIFVCLACVCMQAVTSADALASVKAPVFLVIGCAFGVGKAMEVSGLASAVATGVVHGVGAIFGGNSIVGTMSAIGAVTALLSNLMSNTATCVLMAPIANQIIVSGGFMEYSKAVVLMLVFSANASFATPIATPPNLIVATSKAQYTWGDFFKYGLPLQLVVLPLTAGILLVFYSESTELFSAHVS